MGKKEFTNLLNKVAVQKEKAVPIQKVVPVNILDNNKNKASSDLIKISLSIYVDDWMDILKFRNFNILESKKFDYTISDCIQYGLELLDKKYKIPRDREKFVLKRGRRNKESIPVKTTSIDISQDKINFINDFLYYQVIDCKNVEYTRPEMFSEMLDLIRKENKSVYEE